MRTCRRCQTEKDEATEFYKYRPRVCRRCCIDYVRARKADGPAGVISAPREPKDPTAGNSLRCNLRLSAADRLIRQRNQDRLRYQLGEHKARYMANRDVRLARQLRWRRSRGIGPRKKRDEIEKSSRGLGQAWCKLIISASDRAYRSRQKWRMKNALIRGKGWSPFRVAEHRRKVDLPYERRVAKQRANWLFLANQIPGCLTPKRCKTGHWVRPEDMAGSSRLCRACAKSKKKAWQKRNPLSYRSQRKRAKHRRYALEKGNGGTYTQAEWRSVLVRHDHRCVRCGTSGDMTVDHILPISMGGSNAVKNLQPMCHLCNSRKGATVTGATQTLLSGLLTHLHHSANR